MTIRTGRGGLPRTGGLMTGDIQLTDTLQIRGSNGTETKPVYADALGTSGMWFSLFGAGDVVIETSGGGALHFQNDGTRVAFVSDTGGFHTNDGSALLNEVASNVNPNVVLDSGDLDTGVARFAANQPSMVAGGIEAMRWTATQTKISGGSTHGSFANVQSVVQAHTLAASTSSVLTLGLPAGAFVLGVSALVTTAVGTATSWIIGTPADTNLWGAGANSTGITTSSTDYTATGAVGIQGAGSTTDIVISAVGAAFSAGVIQVDVQYIDNDAPTA